MNKTNQGWWSLAKVGLVIVLFIGAAQTVQAADKGTAANTQMTNTATATYASSQDLGTLLSATSNAVSITINLVQAAPTLAYKDATTLAGGVVTVDITELTTGQTVYLNYTITSQSNGPDIYELFATEVLSADITPGDEATSYPTLIGLGASSVTTATDLVAGCVVPNTGTCAIELPNDGTQAIITDGPNGFKAGDTVVFETGQVCTVDSFVDTNGLSDNGLTLSSINVEDCDVIGATITAGTTIYERAVVSISAVVNTITGTNPSGTLTIPVEARPTTNTGNAGLVVAEQFTPQVLTVYLIDLQIHKFVRNTAVTAACGLAALDCLEIDTTGNIYSKGNVTVNPTQDLEYAILAFNRGGPVDKIIVLDAITNFTSLQGTVNLIPSGTAVNNTTGSCLVVGGTIDGTEGTCTVAGATVTGMVANLTAVITATGPGGADEITISAGHDGSNNALTATTGGVLGVGEVSVVLFTVKVN